MGLEDDLRRAEEHVAEARRIVQRQKPYNPLTGCGRGHMGSRGAGCNGLEHGSSGNKHEWTRMTRCRKTVAQGRIGRSFWLTWQTSRLSPDLFCRLFGRPGKNLER